CGRYSPELRKKPSLRLFRLTTSRYDFFARGRAEGMRVNGESDFQFTITKNFDFTGGAPNEFMRAKQFRRYGFTGGKSVQRFNIHDREFFRTRIVKSALGNAAMQRHLAAFKSAAHLVAGAGLLSFAALAGGAAELGADTAANANLLVARALGRL